MLAATSRLLTSETALFALLYKKHLPEAPALAALRLHVMAGQVLLPWINTIAMLEEEALKVGCAWWV